MHRIRKAKLFRRPNILILPIYLIFFHQKRWILIFQTPCIAKIAYYWLGLSIFKKASKNALHQKGKTFQETQYFDYAHLSHFFHQKMWIFIFWTPCLAKIVFYWLGLSIFERKAPKVLNIGKAKLFRRPNILIMSLYLIFFHQKLFIFNFGTPCIAKIAFYWLGLSIFQKRLPKCTTSERQNFSGDPIF